MTVLAVFPGQGEAVDRALERWCRESESVSRNVAAASRVIGLTLEEVLARGCRRLRSTAVLQPVATGLALGVFSEVLQRGVAVDMVAGHSLGEIPALAAAGVLSDDAALAVAVIRGRAMAREAARNPGGMAALPTSSREAVASAVSAASRSGRIQVAAWNGPGQTVLSGEPDALRAIPGPSTRLAVEGAWHSRAMAGAVREVRAAIQARVTGGFRRTMLFCADGEVHDEPAEVPDLLANQLVSPIGWTTLMASVRRLAPDLALTIGPSKALRGLLRDSLGDRTVIAPIDRPDDLRVLSPSALPTLRTAP